MYLTKGMRDVFMFAWRYAINCRTFACSIVFDEIKRRIDAFEDWEIKDMIEECRHPVNRACVDDFDHEEMDRIAEYLQEVLKSRADEDNHKAVFLHQKEGLYVPVIRVRDKDTGYTHIVGSDSHDMLILTSDGIQYVNMQSCASTMSGEYEFVPAWEDPFEGKIACKWYSPSRLARISDRLAKWRKQFDDRLGKMLFEHEKKKRANN